MLALFLRSHMGSEVMQRSPQLAAKLDQKAPMFIQPGTLAQLTEATRLAADRAAEAARLASQVNEAATDAAWIACHACEKARQHSVAMEVLACATEALALEAAEAALRDDMQ